jgi:hypothetical protein
MDSNIDPRKCDDNLLHDTQKKQKNKTISSDPENESSEYDNIDYWIEDLQLTKVGENILLDSNKWLNDQHLGSVMEILHVEKL